MNAVGHDAVVQDHALRNHWWHPVCHRSEVGKPGDYVRLTWLGEEVVAYNDGGNVLVFDNVCPHRGGRFLTGSCGNGPLTCPYHGWSYRGGRLWVGRREAFDADELARVGLNLLQAEWCGDFLFASAAPQRPLLAQLEGVVELLTAISRSIAFRFDLSAYTYECDWKVAMENALEPYHIDLVHQQTLGSLRMGPGRNEFFPCASVWYTEVTDERTARRLKSLERLFDLAYQHDGYVSVFLYPFSMISSTFGYSYSLQNFFPGGTSGRTDFVSRLLCSALRTGVDPQLLQPFFDSSAEFNRKVFEEDHAICKRVSPGFWDPGRLMPLSSLEAKVAHFRGLYRESLEKLRG